MKNQSCFRDYNPAQLMLLLTDLKQWLPEDDLVYFLIDIVAEMDLQPIYREYTYRKGGQPPYHPKMMVSLLLYAYCVGMPSSRKIEQASYHQIPFKAPSADPDAKRQYNFTDPDSRVMLDGATKSFQQGYNCQAAVDEKEQIIIASGVTQDTNDKLQLKPLVKTIKTNLGNKVPKRISADAGYFIEADGSRFT